MTHTDVAQHGHEVAVGTDAHEPAGISNTMTMPAAMVHTAGHHCRRTSAPDEQDAQHRSDASWPARGPRSHPRTVEPPPREGQQTTLTRTLTLPRFMSTSTGHVMAATANVTQRTVGRTGIQGHRRATRSPSRPGTRARPRPSAREHREGHHDHREGRRVEVQLVGPGTERPVERVLLVDGIAAGEPLGGPQGTPRGRIASRWTT